MRCNCEDLERICLSSKVGREILLKRKKRDSFQGEAKEEREKTVVRQGGRERGVVKARLKEKES